MKTGIESHRTAMKVAHLKPEVTVYLRKLLPGWSRVASVANGYQEMPDLVSGDASRTATGTWQATYSGHHQPIAGDTCLTADDNSIVRAMCPMSWNETGPGSNLYIFLSSSPTTAADWTTPAYTIPLSGGQSHKAKTRGGLLYDTGVNVAYCYIDTGGAIRQVTSNLAGTSWNVEATNWANTDRYDSIDGAAVAPCDDGVVFIYYFQAGDRRCFLDCYDTGAGDYIFTDKIVAMCYDQSPHWSITHWFDAVYLNSQYVLTINSSALGNSRCIFVRGSVISEPSTMLPFDDMDWTGTLKVASLSIEHNRVYGVARQRFLQSDGTYSQDLWTLIWSDGSEHWAQPVHLAIGIDAIYGKAITLGEKVCVISPTSALVGDKTVDFGGSGSAVRLDISSYVYQRGSIQFKRDSGSLHTHQLKPDSGLGTWLMEAQQVVTEFGVQGGSSERIGIGWIMGIQRDWSGAQWVERLTSRGSYAELLDTVQFTDDLLNRGVQVHFSMDTNAIINRSGSIWTALDGILWTEIPNDQDESMAICSSSISGGFEVKARMSYQANGKAFGLTFWSGKPVYEEKRLLGLVLPDGTRAYTADELQDHFFYYIRFEPTGSNTCTTELYQRTGVKVDDVWTDTDTLLGTGTTVTWTVDTFRPVRILFRQGELTVWHYNGSAWVEILTYTPTTVIPERHHVGIYAETYQAKISESSGSGSLTLTCYDASDWPASGTVSIAYQEKSYTFNRTDNVLTLNGGVDSYVSKETTLTLVDSKVSCDWFNVVSAHSRWSVGDVMSHLSLRRGIQLERDNLATVGTWSKLSGTATYTTTWAMTTAAILGNDYSVEDFKARLYYTGFATDNDYIGFKPWSVDSAPTTTGWSARLELDGSTPFFLVYYPDGTLAGGSPLDSAPDEGWLTIVAMEGWILLYINGAYKASFFDDRLRQQHGQLHIVGEGVTIVETELLAGYGVVPAGIWDGQTPARQVMQQVLQGRPIVITERDDTLLRLQHADLHDDLGTLDVSLHPSIGDGKQLLTTPSAMIVHGGYEWALALNNSTLLNNGLRWGKVQNHSLTTMAACRSHGALLLKRAEGQLETYQFKGRVDPAMQIHDKFTTESYEESLQGDFVVDQLNFSWGPAELQVSGSASGVRVDNDSGVWNTDVWGSFEWSDT